MSDPSPTYRMCRRPTPAATLAATLAAALFITAVTPPPLHAQQAGDGPAASMSGPASPVARASRADVPPIIFDGDAIYVGVWAWERHAGQIVPGEAILDFEVTDADAVVTTSATVSAQYNDVELPEGDFTTLLTSLRLGVTAGTGLFIVYNDVQGFDTLQGPQARSLIVKYTRQFDLFGM